MKAGDIVCYQFQVWPRPIFGRPYAPRFVFAKPDELLMGRLFTVSPCYKVAGWRIKKLKP